MAANIYGVSQVNEITPNLYLTSVYGATKDNISRKGITLLVNAAQELPKQEVSGVESIKLFLDDTPYASINGYFDRIADKIHEHSQSGGRSMVHCVLGVSRSTSLCLAYLMKYKNMSLKSAFDYVSARRPCVKPNPGFWRQLQEYEKTLNNSSSSSSSGLNYGSSSSGYGSSYSGSSNYGSSNETSIPITYSSSRSRPSRSLYNNYSSYNANDYNTTYNDLDADYDRSHSGYNYASKSYNDYDSSSYGRSGRSSGYLSNSYLDSSSSSSAYSQPSSYSYSMLSPSSSSRHRTSLLVSDNDSYGLSYGSSSYGAGRVTPISSTTYRSSYNSRY